MRLVLCALPWPRIENAIIQVATLKGYLIKKGIDVIGRYYYKDLVNYIGRDLLDKIVKHELQQYGTAALLFPKKEKDIKTFFKRFLKTFNFQTYLELLKEYYRDVVKDILVLKPDLVGFTISFFQLIPSLYVSKLLKRKQPNIKIVFGGGYLDKNFSFHILNLFSQVDYIVIGEGEVTLFELCKYISQKSPLKEIKGLAFRKGNRIIITKERSLIKNLDSLPAPDYSEFFTHSLKGNHIPYPKLVVEASRGCFYRKCYFCNLNYQWKNCYRSKSDKKVIREIINSIKKYKVLSFLFCDSNMSNRRTLFDKLSKLDYDIEIYAEISGHSVDKSFFRILKLAGVKEIQIGIEALSDSILKKLNKGVDVMRNIEMLKWCGEFGISVFYNLIYGVPNETERDIKETLENIGYVKYFQPPARLCDFTLSYNSFAFFHHKLFGIKRFKLPSEFLLCYPKKVAEKLGPLLSPIVGYELENQPHLILWKKVYREIKKWRKNYERNNKKPGIYFQQGDDFIIITILDKGREKRIRISNKLLSKIYVDCTNQRRSIQYLSQKFNVEGEYLKKLLNTLVNKKLMFRYGDFYFSLGIPIKNSEERT